MKNRIFLSILAVCVISVFLLGLVIGKAIYGPKINDSQKDEQVKYDTITVEKPVSVATVPNGYELVSIGTKSKLEEAIRTANSKLAEYRDSLERKPSVVLVKDTLYIRVPMSISEFTDGSTYRCSVRGYGVQMLWHQSYKETKYITRVAKTDYRWKAHPFLSANIAPSGLTASAGIALDLSFSKNGRWRLVPEVGYRFRSEDGIKKEWYGGASVRYELIRK
ncbi:MAG: hypothetical protein WCS15_01380 [Prevotella sp.]